MNAAPAHVGHEISYYPSFYPQEIRIELLDTPAAAKEFESKTDPLHAYIGSTPLFSSEAPAHLKSVHSLRSFITLDVNLQSPRLHGREERCRAAKRAASALVVQQDVITHRYPVTPYHADYLHHRDRIPEPGESAPSAAARGTELTFRPAGGAVAGLQPPGVATHASDWDAGLAEVTVEELSRTAAVNFNGWPTPPWAKEGWFQAYHLLRPAMNDTGDRTRAEEIYERLLHGGARDMTERVNLERELVATLMRGCERAVLGYRVRREVYNDDFSNGIENIVFDSQSGFNSPVFIRAVKLKDFPWNGWLRVGIDAAPMAAWNPVAGFTDAVGRLVWATVGDDAFLPIPYNSRWVPNRVEVRPDDDLRPGRSVRVPADALMPETSTGRLSPIGAVGGATSKVVYRVLAGGFHDGTEMEPADLLYPYALAFRWGGGNANGVFDSDIAAATRLMRERLRGVRVARVEETKVTLADLTFTYKSPIVEVYLDDLSSDGQSGATLAPPWSSMPWHVLALMEAAVERGVAAFSKSEAERQGLPWLDLVRDATQRAKLMELVKKFAATGFRPAVLEDLVDAAAAKARWQALARFVEESKHLLVTNGPYRLVSATPGTITFQVIRDFTYPVGLGTFNSFAYPPHAIITSIRRDGDRIVITADVELAIKEQRSRRIGRVALKHDTLRETMAILPKPRYVVVGENGKVLWAGAPRWAPDGSFVAILPTLPRGNHAFLAALFLDGNAVNADIRRLELRGD
jgi:hypothetical protein